MNLQAFKVHVASTLVSQQNADIETMDTKDLLEKFRETGGEVYGCENDDYL
jgi:TATA-binding protein-associated factor